MELIFCCYCLLGIVFILVVWSLFNYNASNRIKKITRMIMPLVIIIIFATIFSIAYFQRRLNNERLDIVLNALNMHSDANRLFKNNQEKTILLDSLYFYYHKMDSIAYKDSIYAFLIGKDKRITKTITNTLKTLREQIKRYERLNDLLPEDVAYQQEICSSEDIYLIRPNTFELENLNIAFKIKKDDIKPLALLIQITKTHDEISEILFNQSYRPQPGINSFIIPNYKNEDVIVKLGYVISENDILIYKYLIYGKDGSTGNE